MVEEDSRSVRVRASHMPDTGAGVNVATEKGALRHRDIHSSVAAQFNNSTVPATTSAQPTNMNAGQRLRRRS
jgi:hypothetical protein